jgi:hypothetical protein
MSNYQTLVGSTWIHPADLLVEGALSLAMLEGAWRTWVRGSEVRSMSLKNSLYGMLTLALLAFATGCVKVAPYERGMLAHPTMTPEEISIGLDGHVRAVSEGAAGGLGGGGGGCGCN